MIVRPSIRDVTFIAANMRPRDWEEISCQLPAHYTPLAAALMCWEMTPDDCMFVAKTRAGEPAAFFGWTPSLHPSLWSAWAFGTDQMARVIPLVSNFIVVDQFPEIVRRHNPTRFEARALSTHTHALRWLSMIGARQECVLPAYGKNGEDFVMFGWTQRSIWTTREKWVSRVSRATRYDRSHTPDVHTQSPQSAEATPRTRAAVAA